MVTKLASLFYNGAPCFTEKNSKGYNTAQFEIVVGSGQTSGLSFYITKDGSSPDTSSSKAVIYNARGEKVLSTSSLGEGTYVFFIDLSGSTNFRIIRTGDYTSASLNLRQDEFKIPSLESSDVVKFTSSTTFDTTGASMLDVTVVISNKTANVNTFCIDAATNNKLSRFINNGVLDSEFTIIDNGTYHFVADSRGINQVRINFSNCTYECVVRKVYSYTPLKSLVNPNIITTQNRSLQLKGYGKQLDLVVHGEGMGSGGAIYFIEVQGSNDGIEYTAIPAYVVNKNQYRASNTHILITEEKDTIYANVEGYKYLRLFWDTTVTTVRNTVSINIDKVAVSDDYVNGRKFIGGFQAINASWDKTNKLFIGYKYFKIKFQEKNIVNNAEVIGNVKDCSAFVGVFKNGADILRAGNVAIYDRGMNVVSPTVQNHIYYKWLFCGTPVDGGIVYGIDESAEGLQFVANVTDSRSGYSKDIAFAIECYTERPEPETYLVPKYSKNDYNVFKLPSDNKNRDVLNSDVLEWTDYELIYWQGGYLGVKYVIPFTTDNVANYNGTDKIKFAYLLPFGGSNERGANVYQGKMSLPSRIVVFTKHQVFHNYPVFGTTENPGKALTSDATLFDESAVYNVKKQWLPVNDKSKVTSNRKYFPVLADYNYDQFNGRVNGTTGFVDKYGNGGLPAGQLLEDNLVAANDYWSRLGYSNMTKTTKMCVFGNYNIVEGSEPVVMITDNGGKTWYVKSHFACTDDYPNMRGGKISLKPITDVAPYVANSLKMCRKRFNVPTATVKEPSTPFIVDTNDQSLVTGFSTDSDGNCIVTVADNVDYNGINPIVYFENVSANSEWDYICNTGFTADGVTNNGVFFRVEKVAANQYKLFGDLGNPYEGDMVCRHIHAVNGVEAGILISTGETYSSDKFEGGFVYLLVQNQKNGAQSWDMNYLVQDTIRLTSAIEGVNRASGAYLFSDNVDPTFLYVSDESFPPNLKRSASITGRTVSIPITPAGIYVGKLSDIDDQTKFKCVCELHTTVVGLVQANGHFAADGHGNSIMFSKNGFEWNIDVDDNSKINGFDNLGNIYFGDKVAVFK